MAPKKPVEIPYLNNYQQFVEFAERLTEKNKTVYFMFMGAKKENGRSWCIYCQMGITCSYLFYKFYIVIRLCLFI